MVGLGMQELRISWCLYFQRSGSNEEGTGTRCYGNVEALKLRSQVLFPCGCGVLVQLLHVFSLVYIGSIVVQNVLDRMS